MFDEFELWVCVAFVVVTLALCGYRGFIKGYRAGRGKREGWDG